MPNWSIPEPSYFKLNVKGVFYGDRQQASVGCVLRDSSGTWVYGCGENIGLDVPETAELWSIYYGLVMAWSAGNKWLYLECDSAEAMNAILYPQPFHPMHELILMINVVMCEEWEDLKYKLTHDSINRAAVALANHCFTNTAGGIANYRSPPYSVKGLVEEDMQ